MIVFFLFLLKKHNRCTACRGRSDHIIGLTSIARYHRSRLISDDGEWPCGWLYSRSNQHWLRLDHHKVSWLWLSYFNDFQRLWFDYFQWLRLRWRSLQNSTLEFLRSSTIYQKHQNQSANGYHSTGAYSECFASVRTRVFENNIF